MALRLLGDHPLARDESGKLRSRIATIFPYGNALVTLPGIHATQRIAYVEMLARERTAQGLAALSLHEQTVERENCVDLIVEDDTILIRPNPANMALAFRADELLQDLVPKHKVQFLYVQDARVRAAIKQRGECWRVNRLPITPGEMKQLIAASQIAIGGDDIYYYNKTSGTRLLTCGQFTRLGSLPDEALRQHLVEIQRFCGGINRLGNRELDFFLGGKAFTKADFANQPLADMPIAALRARYEALCGKFRDAIPIELRQDNVDNLEWRNRMYAALILQDETVVSEETLLGLGSEFFMQIEWLPGGRIEDGEMLFDAAFDLADTLGDPDLARLCDEKCRGFIFNFVREYGNLEYVNIGRVIGSLARRTISAGRRDVYVAEIKQHHVREEIVRFIRMQKWGVREHLDEGHDLLNAFIESDEYTDYILDRRLGCRQLGMNLPIRTTARKICETYRGRRRELWGTTIRSTYFERDYIRGAASDKIPHETLADDKFASRLARILGNAAAPNLIVGRCDLAGRSIFDDGDEVVIMNELGLPIDIIVADQTGAFADYQRSLCDFAADYAAPINRRLPYVPHPDEFAEIYLEAFVTRFGKIQTEYRKRKRAFDTLFKHRPRDEQGSLAYRWERVLSRLRDTNPQELEQRIRDHIGMLVK